MNDRLNRPLLPNLLRLVGSLVLVLSMVGCAGGPVVAEVTVAGTQALNPTFDDEPSAVNIRILKLVDRGPFEQAAASAFRQEVPDLPAGSWVGPVLDETVLVDRRKVVMLRIEDERVRFVGVVGLFNEVTPSSRVVIPVAELGNDVALRFDGYEIDRVKVVDLDGTSIGEAAQ